jgi:hypothetical protein
MKRGSPGEEKMQRRLASWIIAAQQEEKNENDGQRLALALLRKTGRESDKSTNGNNPEERIRVKER